MKPVSCGFLDSGPLESMWSSNTHTWRTYINTCSVFSCCKQAGCGEEEKERRCFCSRLWGLGGNVGKKKGWRMRGIESPRTGGNWWGELERACCGVGREESSNGPISLMKARPQGGCDRCVWGIFSWCITLISDVRQRLFAATLCSSGVSVPRGRCQVN